MKAAKKTARASRRTQPVHVLFDLVSRRWAMHILWDLREHAAGFRALRATSSMSPTMLSRRLTELKTAGLISETEAGYALTSKGQALADALGHLNSLADEWYGV